MTLQSRYASAFVRRLRALTRDVPGARAGDVEALHRLRVASRRLREALPAIQDGRARGEDPIAGLRRQVRRLTQALGGVRELDVSLDLVDKYAAEHPDLGPAFGALRSRIDRQRAARRAQMLRTLERFDPVAWSTSIRGLVTRPEPPEVHALRRSRLIDRLQNRADRLAREIDAAGPLYAPYRLHPVRIAAKKLRYALELAREFNGVPTLALTRRVKTVQDLLGTLHDLEVLSSWTRATGEPHAERPLPGARLVPLLDAEIARCHAEYLRHQALLTFVMGRCRTRVLPALRGATPALPIDHAGDAGPEAV